MRSPRSKGGGPIIIVCQRCNNDKSDLHIVEWLYVLQVRKDFRAPIVAALVAKFDTGFIKFDSHTDTGMAPGVFA